MKFSISMILELFTRLLDLWEKRKQRKREERIKNAYEKESDDPDAWFDAEFGSMPEPESSENPPPKPTSKTNSRAE